MSLRDGPIVVVECAGQLFNILVDNTDDHEKNHSLLVNPQGNGRLRLAPAFCRRIPARDMFICGADGQDSTLANAMSQCEAFALTPAAAAAEVAKVIGVVNSWKEHYAQAGVTERDIESLAERIDGAQLLTQRVDFTQERYQGPRSKRKRSSPFLPS